VHIPAGNAYDVGYRKGEDTHRKVLVNVHDVVIEGREKHVSQHHHAQCEKDYPENIPFASDFHMDIFGRYDINSYYFKSLTSENIKVFN
jgi:hypothetical protein